ncbi:hypothetical protein GCM10023176_29980 [Micromonospora coerulea]|uniref:Uncharacterized protein n=1 Tax=Micromonospora coerulea TaxID=47856 RepID=A0ABP8SJX0_9ACTN
MITPPLSISAMPRLTRAVPTTGVALAFGEVDSGTGHRSLDVLGGGWQKCYDGVNGGPTANQTHGGLHCGPHHP